MAEPCEHKWVWRNASKRNDRGGGYNTHFIRVDYYFCEKCLEQKEVKLDDWSRDTPLWF